VGFSVLPGRQQPNPHIFFGPALYGDASTLLPILAYFAGVLTILSPTTLPALPFVLARSDRPLVRNGLPMLADKVKSCI
jgi:hypothetical protein